MVFDHHDVTDLEMMIKGMKFLHHNLTHGEHVVQAAPRICGDELLDADELHDPDGHGRLPEGVALVGVEPALHNEHGDSIQKTDEKTTNVTFKDCYPCCCILRLR